MRFDAHFRSAHACMQLPCVVDAPFTLDVRIDRGDGVLLVTPEVTLHAVYRNGARSIENEVVESAAVLVEHFRVDAHMCRHGPGLERRADVAATEEAVEVDYAARTAWRSLRSLGNGLELGHAPLAEPHRSRERSALPEVRSNLGAAGCLRRAFARIELNGQGCRIRILFHVLAVQPERILRIRHVDCIE